jgi:hypothetical protein
MKNYFYRKGAKKSEVFLPQRHEDTKKTKNEFFLGVLVSWWLIFR